MADREGASRERYLYYLSLSLSLSRCVHCMYIVQCTIYNIQCTMYNLQFTIYNVQHTTVYIYIYTYIYISLLSYNSIIVYYFLRRSMSCIRLDNVCIVYTIDISIIYL